jgi:hypothetical protein
LKVSKVIELKEKTALCEIKCFFYDRKGMSAIEVLEKRLRFDCQTNGKLEQWSVYTLTFWSEYFYIEAGSSNLYEIR